MESNVHLFRQFGYYSASIANTTSHVIVLNTNACYSLNFYLLANATDPGS